MSNTVPLQNYAILFSRQENSSGKPTTPRDVGQDKSVPLFNRSRSSQPYRGGKGGQSAHTRRTTGRSGEAAERSADYACVPFTTQLKRTVKAEIHRIARENKISDSAAGAALLERMLQHNADMQYGALLEPIIQRILRKEMHTFVTLFEWLLVRVAFDTSHTRSLATNMWSRWPGISKDAKEEILRQTAKTAKDNILEKSPQLLELIRELRLYMAAESREQQRSAVS